MSFSIPKFWNPSPSQRPKKPSSADVGEDGGLLFAEGGGCERDRERKMRIMETRENMVQMVMSTLEMMESL